MGAFDIYLLAKQYAPDADAKTVLLALARRLLPGGPCEVGAERPDRVALLLALGLARSRTSLRQALQQLRAQALQGAPPVWRQALPSEEIPQVTRCWRGTLPNKGKVVIQTRASDVLVLEGFDDRDGESHRARAAS